MSSSRCLVTLVWICATSMADTSASHCKASECTLRYRQVSANCQVLHFPTTCIGSTAVVRGLELVCAHRRANAIHYQLWTQPECPVRFEPTCGVISQPKQRIVAIFEPKPLNDRVEPVAERLMRRRLVVAAEERFRASVEPLFAVAAAAEPSVDVRLRGKASRKRGGAAEVQQQRPQTPLERYQAAFQANSVDESSATLPALEIPPWPIDTIDDDLVDDARRGIAEEMHETIGRHRAYIVTRGTGDPPTNVVVGHIELVCPTLRAELSISNDRLLDFGYVEAMHRRIEHLHVRNCGSRTLRPRIEDLSPIGAFERVGAPRELEPGESQAIAIAFAPTKAGLLVVDEVVHVRASTASCERIRLRARSERPRLTIDESELDFRTVCVGSESEMTVRIRNDDEEEAVQLEMSIVEDAAAAFDVRPTMLRVQALDEEEVTVRFIPTSEGEMRGRLAVRAHGGGLCGDVVLIGIATPMQMDGSLGRSPGGGHLDKARRSERRRAKSRK